MSYWGAVCVCIVLTSVACSKDDRQWSAATGGDAVTTCNGVFIKSLQTEPQPGRQSKAVHSTVAVWNTNDWPVSEVQVHIVYGPDPAFNPGQLTIETIPPRQVAVGTTDTSLVGRPQTSTAQLVSCHHPRSQIERWLSLARLGNGEQRQAASAALASLTSVNVPELLESLRARQTMDQIASDATLLDKLELIGVLARLRDRRAVEPFLDAIAACRTPSCRSSFERLRVKPPWPERASEPELDPERSLRVALGRLGPNAAVDLAAAALARGPGLAGDAALSALLAVVQASPSALLSESNGDDRATIIRALGQFTTRDAVRLLLEDGARQPADQAAVIDVLSRSGAAADTFVQSLDDADRGVRTMALDVLRRIRAKEIGRVIEGLVADRGATNNVLSLLDTLDTRMSAQRIQRQRERVNRAEQAMRIGEYASAYAELDAAYRLDHDLMPYLAIAGEIYVHQARAVVAAGHAGQVSELLEEALARGIVSPGLLQLAGESYLMLARQAIKQKDLRAADKALAGAEALLPAGASHSGLVAARVAVADEAYAVGALVTAEKLYRQVLATSSEHATALRGARRIMASDPFWVVSIFLVMLGLFFVCAIRSIRDDNAWPASTQPRRRGWDTFEAGLFGLMLAVAPLGAYLGRSGQVPGRVPFFASVIAILLAVIIAYTKAGAHRAWFQATLLGSATVVGAIQALAGVPPLTVALFALAGFIAGCLTVVALERGRAGGTPLLLVVVCEAQVIFGVNCLLPINGEGAKHWTVVGWWVGSLALLIAVLGLLCRREDVARISWIWSSGLLISLIWNLALTSSLEDPGGPWRMSLSSWLGAMGATLVPYTILWFAAGDRDLGLRAASHVQAVRLQSGDAAWAAGRFAQAVADFDEALWTQEDDGSAIEIRRAHALWWLGMQQDAISWAYVHGNDLIHALKRADTDEARRVMTLLLAARAIDSTELRDELLGHLVSSLRQLPVSQVLRVTETLLNPSAEAWSQVDEDWVRQALLPVAQVKNNLGTAIRVLLDLTCRPELVVEAKRVWAALHPTLVRRLLDVLWDGDVELARRAARLAIRQHPNLLSNYVSALEKEPWETQHHAARQVARIALLQLPVPGVRLEPLLAGDGPWLRLELSHSRQSGDFPPMLVANLPNGRQMLLPVQGERYVLRVFCGSAEQDTSHPTRMHVVVNTSDVAIEPNFWQVLDTGRCGPRALEFEMTFSDPVLDRLTVTLVAHGRNYGWMMDLSLLVCDRSVLSGLEQPVGRA